MPRVSQEAIQKLKEFFDALPEEARNKCALCNETLTHIVKQAEVEAGVGTATATRELASRINETAAPGDRVSGEQLRQRELRYTGERSDICADRTNNPTPKPEPEQAVQPEIKPVVKPKKKEEVTDSQEEYEMAIVYARMAVRQLERILHCQSGKKKAFEYVIEWIKKHS